MRALLITPEVQAAVDQVVTYSKEREHWYDPEHEGAVQPGDFDEHVVVVPVGFRCVFSFTLIEGAPWRMLSISVHPNHGQLPGVAHAEEIARMFGFEGEPHTWQWGVKKAPPVPHVIYAQETTL